MQFFGIISSALNRQTYETTISEAEGKSTISKIKEALQFMDSQDLISATKALEKARQIFKNKSDDAISTFCINYLKRKNKPRVASYIADMIRDEEKKEDIFNLYLISSQA
jgi:Tfp pilus assembly protein PilF